MVQRTVIVFFLLLMMCSSGWAGGNLSIFDSPTPPTDQGQELKGSGQEKPSQLTPLKIPLPASEDEEDDDDDGWGEDSIYDNDKSC